MGHHQRAEEKNALRTHTTDFGGFSFRDLCERFFEQKGEKVKTIDSFTLSGISVELIVTAPERNKFDGAGRGTAVIAAALLFDRRSSLDAAARQFVRAVKGADLRSAGRGFKPHAATFFVSVNL